MQIVIVGGTRFIGPHVVRRLVEAGHEITVYHRGTSEQPLPPGVRHVRSPEAAMPVLRFPSELLHPEPDLLIHMTPMGEADATSACHFFRGHVGRAVWISSGDVYRAYGRFTGLEPGPVEPGLLTEDAPLRRVLFPYREKAKSPEDMLYSYEKILVEAVALKQADLPGTVLRLPKVYGPGENANLATIYGAREHPRWRWTHGYVENVAAAIVLAALSPAARGRIYNVGEEHTPTIGERLAKLPPSDFPDQHLPFHFEHDIVYDTSRIRRELGYREVVPESDAALLTLRTATAREAPPRRKP